MRAWQKGHRPRTHVRDIVVCLGLFLASMVFVSDQVLEHEQISPIDEYQYIDYHAKVIDHGIVRQGEPAGPFARRYLSCHGIRVIEAHFVPELCRAERISGETLPLAGATTADLYSPLYFLPTRVLAQPLVWAGIDLVSAGRLVGAVWLAAAAVLMYLTLRRAGVSQLVGAGAALVLIGSLPAYWSNTYISTDASALLSGAVALALTLEAARGRRSALLLLPLGAAVASLLKLQNLVGFGAASLCLMLIAAHEAAQGPAESRFLRAWLLDRRFLIALLTPVAGVLAQGGWLAIRAATAVGPSPDDGMGGPFAWSSLWTEAASFLPRLAHGALQPTVPGLVGEPLAMMGLLVTIGGSVGLLLAPGVKVRDRSLAIAVLLAGVVAAPALALAMVALEGTYFTLPARYGMSLFPLALACAALLVDSPTRAMRWGALGFGVVAWSLSLTLAG